MAAPLILARTFRDAHTYAQDELGLDPGHYRVVNSAGTLKAVRGVDLHLVPGWMNRPDRFVMKSAMRWCRLNILDVEELRAQEPTDSRVPLTDELYCMAYAEHEARGCEMPEPSPEEHARVQAVLDELSPPGEQLMILPTDALIEDATAFFGEPDGGFIAPPESEETPAKKPGRRRRKCKQCGVLHYKEDPCANTSEEV